MPHLTPDELRTLANVAGRLDTASKHLDEHGLALPAIITLHLQDRGGLLAGALIEDPDRGYLYSPGYEPDAYRLPDGDPVQAIRDLLEGCIPAEADDAISTLTPAELGQIIHDGLAVGALIEDSPLDDDATWRLLARTIESLDVEASR